MLILIKRRSKIHIPIKHIEYHKKRIQFNNQLNSFPQWRDSQLRPNSLFLQVHIGDAIQNFRISLNSTHKISRIKLKKSLECDKEILQIITEIFQDIMVAHWPILILKNDRHKIYFSKNPKIPFALPTSQPLWETSFFFSSY